MANMKIMTKGKTYTGDIIIVGAGAGGLSLACLLAKSGLDVQLIDPAKMPKPSAIKPTGRTVALLQGSLNILSAAGVWGEALMKRSAPLRLMRIMDDSVRDNDTIEIDFDADEMNLDEYGYNVPSGLLKATLFHHAKSMKNITFHHDILEDYVVEAHSVVATTAKGIKITAPLIIGADGRHSKVREIAGIDTRSHDYGQSAITLLINHSRAHDNVATEFHRPSGPLAFVPLPGNQSSIVWVEKTEKAEALTHLSKQDFTDALQAASSNILGGITLETGLESWPLKTLHAKSLTAPRMALIAEAAHVLSPITAQGLNLSLRDVAALAEEIIDAARVGVDIGSNAPLKNYARRRQIDMDSRVYGVDTVMRMVSNDKGAIKALRRTGLKAINKAAPLKTFAMTQGLAPPLDDSRLAKGGAL